MGIGALFEHENHRGTGLKLIADRFLLLIVRKMLDVTFHWDCIRSKALLECEKIILHYLFLGLALSFFLKIVTCKRVVTFL